MKEKIVAFLKGKLHGTSESYLNGIAEHYAKNMTDETQIETTFNDGVIDLLQLNAGILQREGDRRATEATNTAVRNTFEKLGLDENGKQKNIQKEEKNQESTRGTGGIGGTGGTNSTGQTNIETMLEKLLNDKLTPLQEKIFGFEREKTQSQLMGKLTSKLKEKGIPESYYKGRNISIDNENDITSIAASIEQDFGIFRQELAESGVVVNIPQSSNGNPSEGRFGAKIAEMENNAESGIGIGKEILLKK